MLDVMAAAAARGGDFVSAQTFGSAAIEALAGRNADYEQALRERLAGYAAGQAFTEASAP